VSEVSRRIRLLVLLAFFGAGILCFRVFWLAAVEGPLWRNRRAAALYGATRPAAARGAILDARGRVLARDAPSYGLAFQFRAFRRAHPFALLVQCDHLLRLLHRELPARPESLPEGLVEGDPLAFTDPPSRLRRAISGLGALPAVLLRRKGLPRSLAATLRFYLHACFRPAAGLRREFAGREGLLLLRMDLRARERPELPLASLVAELCGLPPTEGATRVLERIEASVRSSRKRLEELAELCGPSLPLPFSRREEAGRRGNLFAYLDALDRFLDRRARTLTQRRIRRREEEARLRRGRVWWKRLAAWLSKSETGLRLGPVETLVAQRFRLDRGERILLRDVPLDPIVTLVAGRKEDYPGFRVRESLRREYPRKARGGYPYRWIGLVGQRNLQRNPKKTGRESSSGQGPGEGPQGENREEDRSGAAPPLPGPGEDLDVDPAKSRLHFTDPEWLAWKEEARRRLEAVRREGLRSGLSGLEKTCDLWLSGLSGYRRYLRDRSGRVRHLVEERQAFPGVDVALTLDADLQDLALEALRGARDHPRNGRPPLGEDARAAMAVLDARNGAVLAMAWLPERVGGRLDRRNTAAEIWHYAVLGSTFKPLVAYEFLRRFGPEAWNDFEPCGGSIRFPGESRIRCDGVHGRFAGREDLARVLSKSCNVFFAQCGRRLGLSGLSLAAGRFGLWEVGEAFLEPFGWRRDPAGPIPLRKARPPHGRAKPAGTSFGALYDRVSLARRGIGYGLEASPLSLARAYAGLGTGGLPDPHLLRRIGREVLPDPEPRDLHLDPEVLAVVRRGLEETVARGGTANRSGVGRFGLAGKTGTAEVSRRRNNAWFTGYVPAGSPRLALSAVFFQVPHGIHGGDHAAEAVARFLEALSNPRNEALWRRYLEASDEEGR